MMVLGMWKKIRLKEPLALVISKTPKHCWVSWKNRKRSDGLWAIIWLCERMRKVVYITARYLIFEGQQKKIALLETLITRPGWYESFQKSNTSSRLVWNFWKRSHTSARLVWILETNIQYQLVSSKVYQKWIPSRHWLESCNQWWVVWSFSKNQLFWVLEKKNQNQRTDGSGYLEKNQNQRTDGSGYWKKKPDSKNWWFWVFHNSEGSTSSLWFFDFCALVGLEVRSGLWNFWPPQVIWICTWCDLWWGFGPEC